MVIGTTGNNPENQNDQYVIFPPDPFPPWVSGLDLDYGSRPEYHSQVPVTGAPCP